MPNAEGPDVQQLVHICLQVVFFLIIPAIYSLYFLFTGIPSHLISAYCPRRPEWLEQMDMKTTWRIKHALVADHGAAYNERRLRTGQGRSLLNQ